MSLYLVCIDNYDISLLPDFNKYNFGPDIGILDVLLFLVFKTNTIGKFSVFKSRKNKKHVFL